jgi:hypothetical protein
MPEHEPKVRMRFFQHIRHLAGQHKDKQGNVLWDVIEAELRKSDGLISCPTGKRDSSGVTMFPRHADGTWGEHSGGGKCRRLIPIGRPGSLTGQAARPHSNQNRRPHKSHLAEPHSAGHGLHDPYSAIRTWVYV